MDEQESRTIFMPFYTHFVRLTGIMPSWARDFCQWVSSNGPGRLLILTILCPDLEG
jgi:hypothetical protein